MRRTFLAALALMLLPQGCGSAAEPVRDVVARLPDGRALQFRCEGQGSPTVILESGWGSGAGAWQSMLPALGKISRTCAYDRAGYGRSDAGPLPRDGAAIARDLDRGLAAARITGPYVLVGHSAGALYVRQFTQRRRRDVAGLVLVDGSVEYQPQRFQAVFGPGAGSVAPMIRRAAACVVQAKARSSPTEELTGGCKGGSPQKALGLWQTRTSELETLFTTTSEKLWRERRDLGPLPLVVLTGERTYSGAAGELWASLHREVAALSRRGETRLVADSGHVIMADQPQAVVKAVTDVVALARQPSKAR